MTKYLLSTTLNYRVETVEDALALRDELQESEYGELTSFSYTTKYEKSKGEIIGEYQIVKAKIEFNSAKEPENPGIDIAYTEKELNF